MPIVQMPDGTHVELPDNPTPDQMQQLQALMAPQPTQQPTPPQAGLPSGGSVMGLLKQAGSGLVEGVTSLPRLFAEGGAAFQDTQSAFKSRRASSTPDAMTKDLKEALPKPQTDLEKYTRSGAEGVGGMALGPGSWFSKVGLGIASGLGGEVGERVGGAPGRLIGSVAGGVAPGAITGAFRGNAKDLAQKGLEGISDAELKTAVTKMRDAAANGTPLTFGQALGRPTNIDSLEAALANSDLGPRVQKILNQQPGQLEAAGNKLVDKLPGEVQQPNQVANDLQDAATSAVNAAKKYRTEAVNKFYNEGGKIPDALFPVWQERLRTLAKNHPNTELGAALEKVADQLVVTGPKRNIEGLAGKSLVDAQGNKIVTQDVTPITDLRQFNEVLKQVYRDIKAPGLNKAPIDAAQDAQLRRALDDIRADLGTFFPKFKEGNALYKDLSERIVDPLKKSVTGQVAGRTGALDDRAAGRALADSVFKQGTTPGGKSNILTLQRDLSRADRHEEFLSAAKSWLVRTLGEVAATGPGGGTTPDLARSITSKFGNKVQAQGLKDTLVGMARAQNLPDQTFVPGFENFLKIAAAQSKRPNNIQGMNPNEIAADAAENLPASFVRVFSFMPAEKMARKIDRGYQERAYTALDQMLTTPEGIAKLQELGKLPVMSQKAKLIVTGFLGGLQGTD